MCGVVWQKDRGGVDDLPSDVEEFGVERDGVEGVGEEVCGFVGVFEGAAVLLTS